MFLAQGFLLDPILYVYIQTPSIEKNTILTTLSLEFFQGHPHIPIDSDAVHLEKMNSTLVLKGEYYEFNMYWY